MREMESGIAEDVISTRREFGSERADALSRNTSEQAQEGSAQSSACAEAGGLLSLFLSPETLSLWLELLGL
jgi:hypothetical protein